MFAQQTQQLASAIITFVALVHKYNVPFTFRFLPYEVSKMFILLFPSCLILELPKYLSVRAWQFASTIIVGRPYLCMKLKAIFILSQ